MTNREAISAEIEPYGISDESIEKGFIDACTFLGMTALVTSTYSAEYQKVCLIGAMFCLSRLRVLASENIGGISQTYNVKMLNKQIEGLASRAGVSADIVLADSLDATITYMPIW